MDYKLEGVWEIWLWCLAAPSLDTVLLFSRGIVGGRLYGLLPNPLKDSIYRLWKYLSHMFISLRQSALSSLAPCSCVCPNCLAVY